MPSSQQTEELYAHYATRPVVTTDSRNIPAGAIFFALRGPSFNGNAFAADALRRGASLAVVDDPTVLPADAGEARAQGYFMVDDVLATLQALAARHRMQLGIPILAITGTNGKTTTKELTHVVLSQRYRTYATRGNLNNHIGVPLTLLSMTPDTELGIVEMGASAPGEIAALCLIARPDYGLITNIGKAHLEGFGGEEGVKAAKGELYDWLAANGGYAFVRRDDATLTALAAQRPALKRIDYDASAAEGVQSRLTGDYNRFNIAAAATIGRRFGVAEEAIRRAVAEYTPTINRSQTIRTERNLVVADCYNANPSSMRAALEWFAHTAPHDLDEEVAGKAVILGDMLELGRWSAAEHRAVLDMLPGMGLDLAILLGPEFCAAADALPGGTGSPATFPDTETALRELHDRFASLTRMAVLLKGSRGMALERIIPSL